MTSSCSPSRLSSGRILRLIPRCGLSALETRRSRSMRYQSASTSSVVALRPQSCTQHARWVNRTSSRHPPLYLSHLGFAVRTSRSPRLTSTRAATCRCPPRGAPRRGTAMDSALPVRHSHFEASAYAPGACTTPRAELRQVETHWPASPTPSCANSLPASADRAIMRPDHRRQR